MVKHVKSLLIVSLLVISSWANGQNVRGFYLCNLNDFLGNAAKEDVILQYAQGNGFNYITFYDLGDINWSSSTNKDQLGAFISKGRNQYGITEFGAVVETYDYVTTNILPFNNSRTSSSQKFDIINLEFEFWVTASINASYCSKFLSPGGYSCDTAGAWKFAWKQFKKIDSLCAANGLVSEVYLGWPNLGQMQQLVSIADRILLHAYRPNDADVYAYSKNRLIDLASLHITKKVIPLFSSESTFMGPWLATHPITRPYSTYSSDLSAETGSFKQYINLQGYHWFTYTELPKTVLATASISASGPLAICSGSSVTLTANSGTQYLWSPGGQTTRSITVSSAGSYTVRVTSTTGANATSSPAVVTTGTGSTPTISASGPVSFCPGSSVTLTSSSSSSYLWSNGATSQSITVSTTGNYSVTAGSGTCSGTSAPIAVNAAAGPTTPVISASGSLNICPGTSVTLTSTAANGYLWSNGATTRTITVSASGNYTVNAYSGPNCSAQSVVTTVTRLTAPATPVITPGGSTTLSPSNPTLNLASSVANSYLWSTTETQRTIAVTSAGSYSVTTTGSNGCKATSSPTVVTYNSCSPPAVPTITPNGSTVLFYGQSVTLTSSTANGYLWSTGATTRSITVSTPGVYSLKVYSGANCFTNSLAITVTQYSGTGVPIIYSNKNLADGGNEDATFQFTAFPNPVKDELNLQIINHKDENLSLHLMDLTGRIVLNKDIHSIAGELQTKLDVSNLTKGIYLASVIGKNAKRVLRIIIE